MKFLQGDGLVINKMIYGFQIAANRIEEFFLNFTYFYMRENNKLEWENKSDFMYQTYAFKSN